MPERPSGCFAQKVPVTFSLRGGKNMNIDHILETMNRFNVTYLLIGGVNYLLQPWAGPDV